MVCLTCFWRLNTKQCFLVRMKIQGLFGWKATFSTSPLLLEKGLEELPFEMEWIKIYSLRFSDFGDTVAK